ncbi:hypothetical protein L226DRAFT_431432, partial [Lentinus tigrinus ALCF2SS1-7]
LTLYELHAQMGHISPAVTQKMVKEGEVCGVKLTGGSTNETCEMCIQAKITHVPVLNERMSDLAKKYGDCIHTDTW